MKLFFLLALWACSFLPLVAQNTEWAIVQITNQNETESSKLTESLFAILKNYSGRNVEIQIESATDQPLSNLKVETTSSYVLAFFLRSIPIEAAEGQTSGISWQLDYFVKSIAESKVLIQNRLEFMASIETKDQANAYFSQEILKSIAQNNQFPNRGILHDQRGADWVLKTYTKNLVPGDQFFSDGGQIDQRSVLTVRELLGDYALLSVEDNSGGLALGDYFQHSSKIGLDLDIYTDLILPFDFTQFVIGGYAPGVKLRFTKGFYSFRPLIGIDLLLSSRQSGISNAASPEYLPLSIYIGGELVWRLGKLRIIPNIGLGLVFYIQNTGTSIATGEIPYLRTHLKVEFNYLLSESIQVYLDLGFMANLAMDQRYRGFNAGTVGVGIVIPL